MPLGDAALFDAAAKALNLTTEQLRDKLSDGKTTIADVAKQQNVDINTVINAMTTPTRQRIGDIVNKPWPEAGPSAVPGCGPAATALVRRWSLRRLAATLDAVAKALGHHADELRPTSGRASRSPTSRRPRTSTSTR